MPKERQKTPRSLWRRPSGATLAPYGTRMFLFGTRCYHVVESRSTLFPGVVSPRCVVNSGGCICVSQGLLRSSRCWRWPRSPPRKRGRSKSAASADTPTTPTPTSPVARMTIGSAPVAVSACSSPTTLHFELDGFVQPDRPRGNQASHSVDDRRALASARHSRSRPAGCLQHADRQRDVVHDWRRSGLHQLTQGHRRELRRRRRRWSVSG